MIYAYRTQDIASCKTLLYPIQLLIIVGHSHQQLKIADENAPQ